MLLLARVETVPGRLKPLHISVRHYAEHHFLARSEWLSVAIMKRVRDRATPALGLKGRRHLIMDDTGFLNRSKHSTGVAHRYCWQLGK